MTTGQREVLAALTERPRSSQQVAAAIPQGTYNQAHSALRRLENRGLVRRVFNEGTAARWELTHAGRSALQLTA